MKLTKNTSMLWDKLWQKNTIPPATIQTLREEMASVRWRRIRSLILNRYGSFKKLTAIELGSGMGTYAALMANEGAQVTLVDYSPKALALAQTFFTSLGLSARFIKADILNLPKALHQHFDISSSCGVAEHFLGKKRTAVLQSHFDVLKPGGMTFVAVPNAANLPYRLYKAVSERGGFWPWGEEYPYRREEFERYCRRNRIQDYGFLGDSFLYSLNYFNPFALMSKKFPLLRRLHLPQTIGTPMDELYAYSLVLWATQPR